MLCLCYTVYSSMCCSCCPDTLLLSQFAVTCSAGHEWSLCVGTALVVEGDLVVLSGVVLLLFLVAKLLPCSSFHIGQNRFHVVCSAPGSSKTPFTFSYLEVASTSLSGFH